MREVVSPLRRYATPRYPTAGEIGEADLSRVPERWKGLRTIVSTIGAVALGLKTLALGGEARDAPASAPTENVPDAKKPQRESPRPVTDVCPLPPASLAGDGEGSFGCVAMNPPVILSEDAALAIIEREFRRRGVTLADAQELDGVEAPLGERERKRENPNLVARVPAGRRLKSRGRSARGFSTSARATDRCGSNTFPSRTPTAGSRILGKAQPSGPAARAMPRKRPSKGSASGRRAIMSTSACSTIQSHTSRSRKSRRSRRMPEEEAERAQDSGTAACRADRMVLPPPLETPCT